MQTATARSMEPLNPPPDLTETERLMHKHNQDLMDRASSLARLLAAERQRAAELERAIRRIRDGVEVVGSHVVDGMLTETFSSGAVRQRRLMVDESPVSFGYVWQWVPLEPIPETQAAIAAEVLAECEACAPREDDREDDSADETETDAGDEFEPTHRIAANLAIVASGRRA
jgi:hypothetical protein